MQVVSTEFGCRLCEPTHAVLVVLAISPQTLIENVMYPVEYGPLAPAANKLFSDRACVRVVLEGKRKQGTDLPGALECFDLHPDLIQTEGARDVALPGSRRGVAVVFLRCDFDAVAPQGIVLATLRAFLCSGDELQRPRLPRLGAARDADRTRDQHGIQEFEGDLAMLGEVLDLSESVAIVLPQVVYECLDGGRDLGAVLGSRVGAQLGCVFLELREERKQ